MVIWEDNGDVYSEGRILRIYGAERRAEEETERPTSWVSPRHGLSEPSATPLPATISEV